MDHVPKKIVISRVAERAGLVFEIPFARVFIKRVDEKFLLSHVRSEYRRGDAVAAIVEVGGQPGGFGRFVDEAGKKLAGLYGKPGKAKPDKPKRGQSWKR